MVKLKLVLIAIVLAGLTIGCKMKKVLPEVTEEGLNTFGVKIDGKVWLPKFKLILVGGGPGLVPEYYKDTGLFGLTASRDFRDEVLYLTVLNVKSIGVYSFNTDKNSAIETEYRGKLVDDKYYPFSGGSNQINITKLDTVNKIVSGTFEVQLRGKKNSVIKNLTQGIFDVKYEN